MSPTELTANVPLAHADLTRLLTELDARAHDLARYSEEARRHGDARQAATHFEHREEVLRLRAYLHECTHPLTVPRERAPASELTSPSTSPSKESD